MINWSVIGSIGRQSARSGTHIQAANLREFMEEFWRRLSGQHGMWLAVTSPGAIPSRLRDLRGNLKRYILPLRRTERRYPRAVKVKMSNYPRKRRSPTGGAAK